MQYNNKEYYLLDKCVSMARTLFTAQKTAT